MIDLGFKILYQKILEGKNGWNLEVTWWVNGVYCTSLMCSKMFIIKAKKKARMTWINIDMGKTKKHNVEQEKVPEEYVDFDAFHIIFNSLQKKTF